MVSTHVLAMMSDCQPWSVMHSEEMRCAWLVVCRYTGVAVVNDGRPGEVIVVQPQAKARAQHCGGFVGLRHKTNEVGSR